jgi:hypothetical protein
VKDGPNFIKQFESNEIKKIIDRIYDNQPDKIQINDSNKKKHLEIINYVDKMEKPKISFWKKLR